MANPIIKPGTFFASYTDSYKIRLPDAYLAGILPTSYNKPPKDVNNPKTSYHVWLESAGRTLDAVEQRKYLLKAINMGVQQDLIGVPEVPSKNIGKSVKKAGSKSSKPTKKEKKSKPKKTTKLNEDVEDQEVDDEFDQEEQEENYVFDETTIQNTILPNQQQLATYKKPIEMPSAVPSAEAKSPSSPVADATPASNDQVFDAMTSLAWRDKDEGLMNATSLTRISSVSLASLFPTMKKLADELFLAIHEKTGALDDAEPEDKYNFLFHVIAKGETMYYSTLADPEFCLYLLDQYQPLYTYMKKKLKIRDD